MQSLQSLVCDYILQHDLAETTADQYHRIAGVYRSWSNGDETFTGRTVSQFLADKQAAGLSSHYRKSLRNHLIALLRFSGNSDKVRPVKVAELEPLCWTTEEVERLIEAAPSARWRQLIAVAYYTGLSHCDLCQIERRHFDESGILRWRRSKTGKRVVAAIPPELLAQLPESGLLFPLTTSGEAFRKTFRRIVAGAGLVGTFKTLRKTAGTLVDREHPGRGHELLANSRKVFESHYRERDAVPLSPPPLAG